MQTYITHNDKALDASGTGRVGQLTKFRFSHLVKEFGAPITKNLDKSDAVWAIRFGDGTVATIYNWKNGKNYRGSEGLELDDIREWNVGGKTTQALHNVTEVLEGALHV